MSHRVKQSAGAKSVRVTRPSLATSPVRKADFDLILFDLRQRADTVAEGRRRQQRNLLLPPGSRIDRRNRKYFGPAQER